MKSKITIEMDFDLSKPVIRIKPDRNSDDVRDKLVTRFLELFGGSSSWAKVHWSMPISESNVQFIQIEPISGIEQMKTEGSIMVEQARLDKEYLDKITIKND